MQPSLLLSGPSLWNCPRPSAAFSRLGEQEMCVYFVILRLCNIRENILLWLECLGVWGLSAILGSILHSIIYENMQYNECYIRKCIRTSGSATETDVPSCHYYHCDTHQPQSHQTCPRVCFTACATLYRNISWSKQGRVDCATIVRHRAGRPAAKVSLFAIFTTPAR